MADSTVQAMLTDLSRVTAVHVRRAVAAVAAGPLLIAAAPVEAEERRFRFGADYVGDALAVVDGGVEQGGALLHQFDLTGDWESGGFAAHLDVQYVGGDALSGDLVGDAQVVSNIEAPEAVRVLQAWVSHEFAGGRAGLKAGLIDLNADFDVQETGGLFLNSSHGVGPDLSQTGLSGPSIFPNTGLALTGFWRIDDGWTARAGVFDGAPGDPDDPRRVLIRLSGEEGVLGILEVERALGDRGTVKVGAWTYSAEFDDLEGGRRGGNAGAYVMVDGRVWSEREREEQGLDAWIRIGVADDEINAIGSYVGGGLVYTGLLATEDQLGLAVAHARFGGPARRTLGLEGHETALELTYAFPVAEGLTVQPDLQYVWNPGGERGTPDAIVAGVRVSFSLSTGDLAW